MIKIAAAEIAELHKVVRRVYPDGVSSGRTNQNMLASIAERPFASRYGHTHYDTIFQQAACLMESIIRWHPFPDGNKRTALLTTHHFLAKNGHYMVVPLDVVRFMVDVAQYKADTEEEIDRLVNRIAAWLEIRTATDDKEYDAKYAKYITNPVRKMILLMFTGVGVLYAGWKLNQWLASDTHPEYAKNIRQTWTFLFIMMRHAEQMKKNKDRV